MRKPLVDVPNTLPGLWTLLKAQLSPLLSSFLSSILSPLLSLSPLCLLSSPLSSPHCPLCSLLFRSSLLSPPCLLSPPLSSMSPLALPSVLRQLINSLYFGRFLCLACHFNHFNPHFLLSPFTYVLWQEGCLRQPLVYDQAGPHRHIDISPVITDVFSCDPFHILT